MTSRDEYHLYDLVNRVWLGETWEKPWVATRDDAATLTLRDAQCIKQRCPTPETLELVSVSKEGDAV